MSDPSILYVLCYAKARLLGERLREGERRREREREREAERPRRLSRPLDLKLRRTSSVCVCVSGKCLHSIDPNYIYLI